MTNSDLDQLAGASAQAETTAEEVVARHLQTVGGIDAAKRISRKTITYRAHMFGRDAYLMERTWSRPNTMRNGPPGAPTYMLTEGSRSWRVGPDGRRELPAGLAASLAKQADFDGPLVDSAQKGITLSYSGLVRYDMSDLHQVTATFEDGVQWQLFFDSRTGLLRKMTQPSFLMQNGEVTKGPDAHHCFHDYRPVGLLSFPHLWIQATDDHTHVFVAEGIEVGE